MADKAKEEQVVEKTEEVVTSVTESPTVEAKTAPIVDDAAEKPVQTPSQDGESFEQPSEQGKAFAEMRHEIKELKKQLEDKKRQQSVFEQIKPSYNPADVLASNQQVDIRKYTDPVTGEFQADAYNQAVNQRFESTQRQSQYIASQVAAETFDEVRAKEKYPQLDTNTEVYDQEFERKVAAQYFFEKYQGKQPSILKIAENEAKTYFRDDAKVQKETAQKIKEELTEKEQASMSAAGRFQPGESSSAELELLRQQTRKGDDWAVAERLRKIREVK